MPFSKTLAGFLRKLAIAGRFTIRTRLCIVGLVLCVPVMMSRTADLEQDRQNQIEAAKKELASIADGVSSSHQELLTSVESFLKTAAFIYARSVRRGAECGLIDAGLPVDSYRITNFSILGEDGVVKCSTLPSLVGISGADKPFFIKAMKNSEITVSDYVLSKGKNEPAVLVTFPTQKVDPELKAAIVVSVGVKWFARLMDKYEARPGAVIFLIDSVGTVLAAKTKQRELVGLPFPEARIIEAILSNDKGSVFDGENDYYSFTKIPGTETRIVAGIDESVMLAPINKNIAAAYWRMVFAGLLILIGAWILTEWLILRPIREIAGAARLLSAGNRHLRADAASLPPEFRSLASAFNTMADSFETRQDQLETVNVRLNELSTRDPLSKLLNRRALESALEGAWRDRECSNAALAFMMIDVDRFKQFNDRYGHIAGDDCLRRIAAVLDALADIHGALAARYGGEEFAFVLSSTSATHALEVGESIRRAIRNLSIAHSDNGDGVVTVSIGLQISSEAGIDELEKLIAGADQNLYSAKRRGRNLVVDDRLRVASSDEKIAI